jgi:hypothetical protein
VGRAARPLRTPNSHGTPAAAAMTALQRRAGNASTLALLRRAHNAAPEPPGGWIHDLTVTMDECMVSSSVAGDEDETLTLTFSRMQVER